MSGRTVTKSVVFFVLRWAALAGGLALYRPDYSLRTVGGAALIAVFGLVCYFEGMLDARKDDEEDS